MPVGFLVHKNRRQELRLAPIYLPGNSANEKNITAWVTSVFACDRKVFNCFVEGAVARRGTRTRRGTVRSRSAHLLDPRALQRAAEAKMRGSSRARDQKKVTSYPVDTSNGMPGF